MIAPCGPSPAIVANDSSMNPACFARKPLTTVPISCSSCVLPAAASASSQHQNDAIATPSRRCASSIPFSSASFFTAFASGIGETPSLIAERGGFASAASASSAAVFLFFFGAPAPVPAASSAAATSAALTFSGSTHSVAPFSATARTSSSHASYALIVTPAVTRRALTSSETFRSSTYSVASVAPTSPYAIATGLHSASPPRTLNSHATSSRGLTTR
mmetsp:Transcript_8193/g.29933  ORF Transcript_8193/g.29933 Transcript_8193/m.29933 type:complete len:218 (+) Transcript_8193:774-1427(+)